MEMLVPIVKVHEEQRVVFGWANVPHPLFQNETEPKIDLHGEQIPLDELEKAAYEYVEMHREVDEMHGDAVVGRLVESFVVTPEKLEKMGLPGDALPLGWWVGYRLDQESFDKVKSGVYKMFSIGGSAKQV